MVAPLLETKLYAPRPPRSVVSRGRLSERLRRGTESRVTLISAPAGFGKTTLLAELAAAGGRQTPIAWVSLDAADNEPAVFWRYVIAALDRAVPGLGTTAHALLDAPERAADAVVPTILNDLAAAAGDVVLVLDDYHFIERSDIADAMSYLVEHLPPNGHLVIGTRADPALPLARLRARGELVEIRAADLRFSPDEAAAYLNGPMALGLNDHHVEVLEGRTEGWIAALQLAALSMEGRGDVDGFVAGFAGDDRYVVDYLVEEVLRRQPEEVRAFLLTTSILSRMTGPLCDAVTGTVTGGATLEGLERGNLFLVALDDRRRWYRYHHLFSDVLRAHLLDERPDKVPELHRRASQWYARHGDPAEAVGHALAGRDVELAADLVERAMPEMLRSRREWTVRAWAEALPRNLFEVRPVLAMGYVGALMSTGQLDGVEPLLRAAERSLADPGAIVVDATEARRLPAAIARYRAAQALAHGDLASTAVHAEQAFAAADADDHLGRGAAAALLGLAEWASGNLDAAYRSYADGMASLERGGHLADVVGGAITLADIRLAQGRLGEATRIYQRGLARATEADGTVLRGAADMHVGLADMLYERNDLEGAARHLEASRALGDGYGLPKFPWRSRVTESRLRRVAGDLEGAIELLDAAEELYVSDFAPNVRPVGAVRAQVWIAQGRLGDARDWTGERGLHTSNDVPYVREFEHLVLARLLVAQGQLGVERDPIREALALTDRMLVLAEDGGRGGSVIEILVVAALARHALGDAPGSIATLGRAAVLAQPEGYVRVFLDEGPPMTALLQRAARERNAPDHVRLLSRAAESTGDRPAGRQPLVEPLSDRELEVLRLLQGDLDGPEMARELSVSLNTLRTHTKNIYAKLGVTSRRAAVRRAGELDLLGRP